VDKRRSLRPDYEPADLASLNEYPLAVTRKDLRLRKAIMPAVLEMNAAAEADGVRLAFASSYRSYEYQDGLFKRYAAAYGEAEASRFSARPGTSQHQLGTAIDFDPIDESFAATAAGAWMEANATRFGFSISFPRGLEAVTGYMWESWHYRYITKPGAALEREYFGGVQHYLMEFLDAYREN
jgi:D-alanyl-D-alanine carboxypeptidase